MVKKQFWIYMNYDHTWQATDFFFQREYQSLCQSEPDKACRWNSRTDNWTLKCLHCSLPQLIHALVFQPIEIDPQLVRFDPQLISAAEAIAVRHLAFKACSCQNLAWRLVKYIFKADELKGRNCFGRRGKQCLDEDKLLKVKQILSCFYIFDTDESDCVWKQCCVAIDAGLRNTSGLWLCLLISWICNTRWTVANCQIVYFGNEYINKYKSLTYKD